MRETESSVMSSHCPSGSDPEVHLRTSEHPVHSFGVETSQRKSVLLAPIKILPDSEGLQKGQGVLAVSVPISSIEGPGPRGLRVG